MELFEAGAADVDDELADDELADDELADAELADAEAALADADDSRGATVKCST